MRRWRDIRGIEWLPTGILLAVILLGGARLIFLSVQHHAAVSRATADALAREYAARIAPEIGRLQNLAAGQAASAAIDTPAAANAFWMSDADRVIEAPGPEAATAAGIASEWRAAESVSKVAGPSLLGPLRLGSEWLMAVRVPVAGGAAAPVSGPGRAGTTAAMPAWSVAYVNLDEMLTHSHLARLIDKGYDFELSQVEPHSAQARVFLSSNANPLVDAAAARIDPPAGVAAAVPGSYLQLALRPRNGWYPAADIASDVALLTFLAWLIAFGTQELSHELHASRSAIAAAERKLRSVNKQLASEMQQRVALQETFDHARFHDAFTGLPNRRYFMDQLDRALRDVRSKQRERVAVIIIDISRFKLVNDMLGHTAGDELMVEAARRFGKLISTFAAILARWSGDQFALLLLEVPTAEAALKVAALLRRELRAPFELRRHRLVVTATVGLTLVDSGQQRAEDVVREADLALTVAKRKDSEKIVIYAPTMAGQAASLVSLEADLHVAMEKHELQLVFQPIVNLHTYQMVGAEALLRWRHPVESLLAPDRFLRIAEEAGLMVQITRWIVLRVVRLAAEWRRQLPANQDFFISMNMSPTALQDPGLSDHVAAVLRENQMPASVLKFELTEAALIGNAGAARDTMDRLHAMGVQLMLDDFGTGYSSLSYLQLFPFDFVKIDRPFVNRGGADAANSGMMAAMVQMAGSLNLTPIAEIIETEAAAKALQAMGCDYGQGFYFSGPIEADHAFERLRTRDPFRPAQDASATMIVEPLAVDDSPTRMVRPLTGESPAIMVPPLSADESPTMVVRPLEVDDSPTIMVPPLTVDDSPTMILRPLTDDDSPTLMIPSESIKFEESH